MLFNFDQLAASELGCLETPKGLFKSRSLVDVKWYRPELTVRVKHLAVAKTVRHATVRGLR